MKKFEVIEDNGGGLTLVIFGVSGIAEYLHTGYEYIPGQLKEDLRGLWDGDDPASWDGNADDPQTEYESLTAFEYGWEIIADNNGLYPLKMGRAASLEFGVDL